MGASMDCVGADASVASVGGAIISAIIEESEVLERIAVKRSHGKRNPIWERDGL